MGASAGNSQTGNKKPRDTSDLLERWRNGDAGARDELVSLLYPELRRLAQSYLRSERIGHTLQATALVNEAYLRLIDQRNVDWKTRAHFISIVSTTMRRILVDYARRRSAGKRGWNGKVTLDEGIAATKDKATDMIALDQALTRLAAIDPRQSELVELRYFGGLTVEETASVLGISAASVKREWMVARAWLRVAMGRAESDQT